jgi:hypothetical protein
VANKTASYSGTITSTIDDLKIWNGVTSISSRPSNVQDNSLLVEKDTARRYWFDARGADTTTTNSNVNDVAHFELQVGANYVIGEQITSGNALIGKEITSLSFWLYKLNSGTSGTETFTFGIWDSSGALQKEYGSITRGEIPQGSTYTDAQKFTKTDSDGYVLQENDIIGVRTDTNPNGAWTVEIQQRDSDVYSNGQRALFIQGSTPVTSAKDIGFEVVSRTPATWTKQTSVIPTVSGLKLHLDASDSTTITKNSSNYVSAWNDKSGEGNHLTQSTASKQPLWVNDTLDTLPVIRFDGSDDQLNRPTFVNGAISQGFYMFVVMKPTSGVLYNFDSGSGTRGFCYSNNTVIQYGCATDTQIDSTIPTTHVMYTFFVNGASSNVRKNSTSINSSNLGSSTINGLWLASRHTDASFGSPDIAEVLIYDNDIGTTNRDAIESYLTDKWGL